jgi:DNA-binding transcriptional ArsR family regulator
MPRKKQSVTPEMPELRKIPDASTIRALSHPVRVALIEALGVYGPMTATEAGELIGELPTTCSFHLRQLARYGFVEEAGGGKGRARPWKMTSIGMSIPASDDAETAIATSTLVRLFRKRQLARYETWLQTRTLYPKRWRAAAGDHATVFWLTVEELEALNEEFTALALRYRDRLAYPAERPKGAIPVELLMFRYPIGPPPKE